MAAVRFENVSKYYGEVVGVETLDLTCQDGEMLALLGPSGCGKSTTLKMVAGIETPSSGSIWFGDRMVSDLPPGARNIAMVFEDYALYPHLTAFENIAFPLKVRGMGKSEIQAKVGEAIDLLGLADLTHSRVAKLSGGAQQRIAIGRALVREPDLILFDEPLSHLDADQKVQLRTQIKRLQQTQGVTSILVTHDQTEAIAMCDRIAVMNHGVLQQVGPPQQLYDHPANLFVANFIGEPPMNQITITVANDADDLLLSGNGLTLRIAMPMKLTGETRNWVLGIRPEHVLVEHGSGLDVDHQATPATVFAREPRGDTDTLLLMLEGGDVRMQAEVAAPNQFRPGDQVSIRLPESKLILFDADSGMNLQVAA